MREFYLIYRIDNTKDGKYYIGAHKTNNIDDSYMGSGKHLKRAIIKHGKGVFTKNILICALSEEDMYFIESLLVTPLEVNDRMCYNLKVGGEGGFDHINNDPEMRKKAGDHGRKSIHKAIAKYKELRALYPEKYMKISQKNINIAIEFNKGKKREKHSEVMKEHHRLGNMPIKEKKVYTVIWNKYEHLIHGHEALGVFYDSLGFESTFEGRIKSVLRDGIISGTIDLDEIHKKGLTKRSLRTCERIYKLLYNGVMIEILQSSAVTFFINSLGLKHRSGAVMDKTNGWKAEFINLDWYIENYGYKIIK